MIPFPVSSSILSATHLSQFVKSTYGLLGDVDCRLIKAGVNHTYLVNDGSGKYIFRLYSLNWRTKDEISEELRLINHLKNNDIPVSYPVADTKGDFIQQLDAPEGIRYAVMFSFAAGEKMHNSPPETHFRIGTIVAAIHKHTLAFNLERINYTAQTLLIEPFEQLKQFLPADTDEMISMSDIKKYLVEEFQKVNASKVRQGAVHLDIWFDNLNINAQNEITLFDFDFCGNGWLCLDIAYYLLQLYVLEPDEKQYKLKADSFLKGYESITPISEEEKRILFTMGTSLYFFYLGVQCQRFENWSNTFLNDAYLKRFIIVRVKKYFEFSKTFIL